MQQARCFTDRRTVLALAAICSLAAAAASANGFQTNDFITYSQVAWGQDVEPGNLGQELQQDFDAVFASSNDLMQIGIPGSGGYSIIFDDPSYLTTFLPATGAPGPLTVSLLDPVVSSSGSYGGEVATMDLNIAFSDAGLLKGNLNLPLGSLVLTNLTGDLSFANGLTVRQVYADANTVLGGGPTPSPSVTLLDVFTLINDIDMSFNGGPPSQFAQQNYVYPTSTTQAAPEVDVSSAAGGLTLLAGVLVVMRRRPFDHAESENSRPDSAPAL